MTVGTRLLEFEKRLAWKTGEWWTVHEEKVSDHLNCVREEADRWHAQ